MDRKQCRRLSEYYASSIYKDDILSIFPSTAQDSARQIIIDGAYSTLDCYHDVNTQHL